MSNSQLTTSQPSRQTLRISTSPNNPEYYTKGIPLIKGLSITQLVLGLIPICIQVYGDLQGRSYYFIYYGWWVGVIMLVAGSVGTAGAFKNKRPLIITHLVFNALLIPVCGLLIVFLSFFLSSSAAIGVTFAVGFIQFDLAIILIVFNSKAVCCKFIKRQTAVAYQRYPSGHVMAAPGCGFDPQPGCAPPYDVVYPVVTASNEKAPAYPVAHLPAYSAQERKSSPPQYEELFPSF